MLKSQKLGEHEAETEKLKNTFLAILRDIKKDMDAGEVPGTIAPANFTRQIREQLALQSPKEIKAADVAAIVTQMVGQAITWMRKAWNCSGGSYRRD